MKFGKLLQGHSEAASAGRQSMFLDYKKLQKLLNRVQQVGGPGSPAKHGHAGGAMSVEEAAFVDALNDELRRFNEYFVEKEEEYVIRVKDLEDRLEEAGTPVARTEVSEALVHIHGGLVLQLHWSSLNYASLVKILKKHDKVTGLSLRSPFLANVLRQPFSSTSIMRRLAQRVEELLRKNLGVESDESAEAAGALEPLLEEGEEVEYSMLQETKSALTLWRSLEGAKYASGGAKREREGEDDGSDGPDAKKPSCEA